MYWWEKEFCFLWSSNCNGRESEAFRSRLLPLLPESLVDNLLLLLSLDESMCRATPFLGDGDAGGISFSKDLVAFVHSVELNFIGPGKYSGYSNELMPVGNEQVL